MTTSILCTGDIHLGRRPMQISDRPDRHVLGPTSAWRSFVETAVNRKVDVAVLTGDVVDEMNKFYEAFSVLCSGVERMVSAGITVLAVAGNHDFDVLPRLADQIPGFHLLGRGGQWQEFIHERDGSPVVRFQGWSFPASHVSINPLATYRPPPDGVPTIGVLHCDCDVAGSTYCPVSLTELGSKGLLAWLLGHVHTPNVLSREHPLILYPGSLQGLDPGEPGLHSAILLTLEPGNSLTVENLPLAALRWECLDVPVDSVGDEEALQRALTETLRGWHGRIEGELGETRLVGCRLRLLGRTPLHRDLPGLIPATKAALHPQFGDVEYLVESIVNLTRPSLCLDDLARSTDPAGLLARRLLLLETRKPADEYQGLIERGKRSVDQAQGQAQFAVLQNDPAANSEEQVRDLLLQSGLRALDELLAQKEPPR